MDRKTADAERRIHLLDEIRGFAILCMVFFHGFYDMAVLFGFSSGESLYDFFLPAEPFFAGAFILISGISSRLSHSNLKRGLKLLLIAISITAVTILILPLFDIPDEQIYFGILHFLAAAILLFALLRPLLDKIGAPAGIIISVMLYIFTVDIGTGHVGFPRLLEFEIPSRFYLCKWLLPLGLPNFTVNSADYFPILPWIFVFLVGTYIGIYAKEGRFPKFAYKSRVPAFQFLGRHSLLIYLVHQPILYLIFEFASLII